MLSKKEISALISLLDDSDTEVSNHVHARLYSLGQDVIPSLESAWEKCFNAMVQERIENIIHDIQFDDVRIALQEWLDSKHHDLLEGVMVLAKYQYPDLDKQKVINQIEDIKRDIWLEMNNDMSPLEKVKLINHILYSVHGFGGNTKNYHDPQNSYINMVLDSRRGNQISLAIVYAIIAQKLDLPIYGVNLPQHFVLAYQDPNEVMPEDYVVKHGVVFYINAFNRGFVFSKRDIDYFLKQLNLEPEDSFYTPCTTKEIMKRVVRNLISAYEKSGSINKADELNELYQILDLHK